MTPRRALRRERRAGVAGTYFSGRAAVATRIAVDGNGNFLVALDTGGVARFTSTGAIDTAFGAGGLAPTTHGVSLHRKLVVQKNGGRILVSGQGSTQEQVVVSALWP